MLHQFLISIFSAFVWKDTQRWTAPKTIPWSATLVAHWAISNT